MAIKLIIFDMAGTTVHDKDFVNIALQKALSEENIDCSRNEINDIMGMPKPLAIKLILTKKLSDKNLVSSEYITKIHSSFHQKMVNFYSENSLEIFGTTEAFKKLKAMDIKIAIDTGFDRKIADTIFNKLEWVKNGLVDYTVTSDEVINGRPHPDMVFKAMHNLGIDNIESVAKVGDTPADLNEGNSAGCKLNIGVLSGASTREQLAAHPHTHIVGSIIDIPQLIISLN
jgi:phosphonatase-like hydrolase